MLANRVEFGHIPLQQMMCRALILSSLLVATAGSAAAAASDQIRLGENALASGLWEVATGHFEDAMAAGDASEREQVTMLLAEALVRGGNGDKAIALLDGISPGENPEALFWRAQANAAMGKFSDAVEMFAQYAGQTQARHLAEAVFSMASLQLSLGLADDALQSLSRLQGESRDAVRARLREVEILLDAGRYEEARHQMLPLDKLTGKNVAHGSYLEARILLGENQPEAAAQVFKGLLDLGAGANPVAFHSAAIGYADALHAAGKDNEASAFLVSFVSQHPDSPVLEMFFERLLGWMPEHVETNDPVLERVSEWIPPVPAGGDSLVGLGTPHGKLTDLEAFALYLRAQALHKNSTEESVAEAKALLSRLSFAAPSHFLADRALFDMARWAYADGDLARATSILHTLSENAKSPTTQGSAVFLLGQINHRQGMDKQAIAMFDEAAGMMLGERAEVARRNAILLMLQQQGADSKLIAQAAAQVDEAFAKDLPLEKALAMQEPQERKTALEKFMAENPHSTRLAEAQMAWVETSLVLPNPDLQTAKAMLTTLAADAANVQKINPLRLDWSSLRLADLSGDSEMAVALSRKLLDQYPNEAKAVEAAYILGKNLYQTGNYNDARIVLEKLAGADTASDFTQAAWLLAARSAALVPTEQSREDALKLFDRAIEVGGDVTEFAKIEKARLMIDLNLLAPAIELLAPWFAGMEKADPLRVPVGLMLAEAYYAQGSSQSDSLTKAIAVHDALLEGEAKFSALFNRLQYMRGRALEQLQPTEGEEQSPTERALKTYYSVLECEKTPAEWDYFERCGFGALAILEKQERWPAAVACARKIAGFNGPRAEEAAERARQLGLAHMIWDD